LARPDLVDILNIGYPRKKINMIPPDIEVLGSSNQPPTPTTLKTRGAPPPPKPAQKSWVWSHFKLNVDQNKVKCLVPDRKKGRNLCGTLLARNPTSSTKSMSEHLKQVHHMLPPNQEQKNQLLLPNLMKRQRVEHRVSKFSSFR